MQTAVSRAVELWTQMACLPFYTQVLPWGHTRCLGGSTLHIPWLHGTSNKNCSKESRTGLELPKNDCCSCSHCVPAQHGCLRLRFAAVQACDYEAIQGAARCPRPSAT